MRIIGQSINNTLRNAAVPPGTSASDAARAKPAFANYKSDLKIAGEKFLNHAGRADGARGSERGTANDI